MILTAGCSWTEQYHDLFPVWPHLLNKPVKNIGESGTNNLEIAKDFFEKDTLIYIDDFNIAEVENATRDFLTKYSNQFKIIKEIKTAFNMHPTFWNGFILFKKK